MGDRGGGRGATPLFTFADVHVELDGRDVLRASTSTSPTAR